EAKLALSRNPHRSAADLLDDCLHCAVDKLVADAGGPAWTAADFARLQQRVRAGLNDTLFGVVNEVREVLAAAYAVEQRLRTTAAPPGPSTEDIRQQLAGLVYRGFVTATGWDHLPDLPRYLRAIERRLDRLPANARRDRELTEQVHELESEYEELRASAGPEKTDHIRWMIEEVRVNYLAKALGTAYPVP